MFDLFGDIEVKPVLKWVGVRRTNSIQNIIKTLNQQIHRTFLVVVQFILISQNNWC